MAFTPEAAPGLAMEVMRVECHSMPGADVPRLEDVAGSQTSAVVAKCRLLRF